MSERRPVVYLIFNRINGKIYIGQTKQLLARRVYAHRYSREPLGCAMRKYGWQNFAVAVIDGATSKAELDDKERTWIAYYDSLNPRGYNVTRGGDGVWGVRHSEESKRRQSELVKRRYQEGTMKPWNTGTHGLQPKSEETRLKMSVAMKGKNSAPHPWLSETNRKNSGPRHRLYQSGVSIYERAGQPHPLLGKHHSEESRAKMSKARIGKTWSEHQREAMAKRPADSAETRRKKGKGSRAAWQDPEYKRKMSEARKKMWAEMDPEVKANRTAGIRPEIRWRKKSQ